MILVRKYDRSNKTAQYLLHKVQHDGLGDHVDHGTLNNVVVGRDEQLCEIISNMQLEQIASNSRTDNFDLDVLTL